MEFQELRLDEEDGIGLSAQAVLVAEHGSDPAVVLLLHRLVPIRLVVSTGLLREAAMQIAPALR